jgi:hypothetical protein
MTPGGTSRRTDVTLRLMGLLPALLALATAVSAAEPPRAGLPTYGPGRDGIVSLQELYEYVEQQVTVKARGAGGNQHPVMKGEMQGALPPSKVRAR